jgi:DNA mismatch endonuclease (patch repair protein)
MDYHLCVDHLSAERRSALMSSVRGKNTKPERILRMRLHAAGYRYRLHVRKLPGSPDLVFPSRKKIIFVHGCFWHLHARCNQGGAPKSNLRYWRPKLEENRCRDLRNARNLRLAGWRVLIVWGCALRSVKKINQTLSRVVRFLEED